MYGLTVFSSGHGPERFQRAASMARRAEEAGFDAFWTGELYNQSATIPMAALALATGRARIGSNIAYGVGRTPLVWAAEARDLDELSGGRLILGLGNGTPGMMENWHGVSGQTPAVRMEELVEVLRKLWRLHEGPVHHDGPFYRVHLQPTAETPPPCQEHLPIWTAGVNPRMIRAAGRVADGLVGHPMFTARYVDEVIRPQLAAGAGTVGRETGDITVMGILICAVDADEEAARRRLAYAIAQYAASRVYDRLFAMHGWAKEQVKIREAAQNGDTEALIAAVPDAALEAIGVACTPDRLAEKVAGHAVGYDHLNLVVPPWGLTPEEAETATLAVIEGVRGILLNSTPDDLVAHRASGLAPNVGARP
ncbi:LLM class flavin-dependent oxidoreductase [Streptomyces sp. NPDC058424]|uniref:LLM class flavin-dependent oxidoreductase n=1 Tax=Streptomyces sp. NPDC058424 TaxID=3346491 RepID=UPI0036658713